MLSEQLLNLLKQSHTAPSMPERIAAFNQFKQQRYNADLSNQVAVDRAFLEYVMDLDLKACPIDLIDEIVGCCRMPVHRDLLEQYYKKVIVQALHLNQTSLEVVTTAIWLRALWIVNFSTAMLKSINEEALESSLLQAVQCHGADLISHQEPLFNFVMAKVYQHGIGVAKDPVQAFAWYEKAAREGYAPAQNNLGGCFQNGFGVAKDPVQAFAWYEKAAQQGLARAQNNLGRCFQKGFGVVKDPVQAVAWTEKAAQQGVAEAQYNLGVYFNNGFGVAKDPVQAVAWYEKAAQQGNATAKAALVRLQKTMTTSASTHPVSLDGNKRTKVASEQSIASLTQTVASDSVAEPNIKRVKVTNVAQTLFAESSQVKLLNKDQLRRVAKVLRGQNNAQHNCVHLAHDMVRYMLQREMPSQASKADDSTIDDFKVWVHTARRDAVVKQEMSRPRTVVQATTSVVEVSASQLAAHMPFDTVVPENENGVCDLTTDAVIIDLEQYTQPGHHFSKLPAELRDEAQRSGGESYGLVNLARCGQNKYAAGHQLAYYATTDGIYFIDCQLYDGKNQQGEPVFRDLASHYRFASQGPIQADSFGDTVFHIPMQQILADPIACAKRIKSEPSIGP